MRFVQNLTLPKFQGKIFTKKKKVYFKTFSKIRQNNVNAF